MNHSAKNAVYSAAHASVSTQQSASNKTPAHYRMTFDDALRDYDDGLITAKGLVYYAVKTTRADGWKMPVKDIEVFCGELGISVATYYRAVSYLKTKNRLDWEAPGGMNLWVPKSEATPLHPEIEPGQAVSQPCETQSQPCETQSQPCETQSQPCETQSQPCETQSQPCETECSETPLDKLFGNSPDLYKPIQFSINLSQAHEREKNFNPLEEVKQGEGDLDTSATLTLSQKPDDEKPNTFPTDHFSAVVAELLQIEESLFRFTFSKVMHFTNPVPEFPLLATVSMLEHRRDILRLEMQQNQSVNQQESPPVTPTHQDEEYTSPLINLEFRLKHYQSLWRECPVLRPHIRDRIKANPEWGIGLGPNGPREVAF